MQRVQGRVFPKALSLLVRPGSTGIATRRVAILAGDRIDCTGIKAVYAALLNAGAVQRIVGVQLGAKRAANGGRIDVEISLEAGP